MRYPIKTSMKTFCDTIATSIARYEKYRCWASKSNCKQKALHPFFGVEPVQGDADPHFGDHLAFFLGACPCCKAMESPQSKPTRRLWPFLPHLGDIVGSILCGPGQVLQESSRWGTADTLRSQNITLADKKPNIIFLRKLRLSHVIPQKVLLSRGCGTTKSLQSNVKSFLGSDLHNSLLSGVVLQHGWLGYLQASFGCLA